MSNVTDEWIQRAIETLRESSYWNRADDIMEMPTHMYYRAMGHLMDARRSLSAGLPVAGEAGSFDSDPWVSDAEIQK